jgi:NAD(P)-dependent dehydrogenase (short-subunit alcohol dehydrogenase family)
VSANGSRGATLEGRIALVTGGGRGMGRAHCLELARRGARVAAIDLDGDVAEETAQLVRNAGGEAVGIAADVADRRAVEAAVDQVAGRFGGLDVVVSNAGLVNDDTTLEETDDDAWHRMLAVNVDGALHVTRAACPWLRRSGHGRVVIVSSMWGQVGPGHSYAYVAAKGALIAFAKNLAVELAGDGVLVNAIAPGSIRTRMIPDAERELALYPIPVGRMAEPEEVSYLVAFLASDEAAFITGQVIPINGGAEIVGI